MTDHEQEERAEREHASNIGLIVLAMAGHEIGDYGDGSINDTIMNIIDEQRPAHELLRALAGMDRERAAGIVRQCYVGPCDRNDVSF
jgi:hypothetical protein